MYSVQIFFPDVYQKDCGDYFNLIYCPNWFYQYLQFGLFWFNLKLYFLMSRISNVCFYSRFYSPYIYVNFL